ncbi:uncharacterized protein K460DRAFT_209346 [Cucurbitaria berberidis CBS 394.84]|uniref:Uncharacterized protein n=1 Tax=Cucurbitaria berberidis CBS 394.84 TaxID=1168544 RepID=A0A9P4L3N3_9PLEO|nr:uncharacterized protein K460DRAFT_209346 [Cucurbitaria berberidis CBS 394.84]KAF1840487.1 hypothetical protein K460DRAFT_209346 [Cucurbitaria berberidis CBS 394.84]
MKPHEGKMNLQDATSIRNQQESRLLCLPAEIRLKIYGYALGGLEIGIMSGRCWGKQFVIVARPANASRWEMTEHLLALTASCRQIHAETKLLPYSMNEFVGSRNYLKPLITGGLFDSALVLVVPKIRVLIGCCDVEEHSGAPRLERPLADMLLVFRGLPGLKRVTLDWDGQLWGNDWEYLRGCLLKEMKRAFDLEPRLDHIEVEAVNLRHCRVEEC